MDLDHRRYEVRRGQVADERSSRRHVDWLGGSRYRVVNRIASYLKERGDRVHANDCYASSRRAVSFDCRSPSVDSMPTRALRVQRSRRSLHAPWPAPSVR
jgi:hypothetical protein